MAYWYNVMTRQVETDDSRSRAADVLGPYATREEAERAIETAHARTDNWEREDESGDADG